MQKNDASVIGDCLARIRTRLLLVRTAERAAIALLWAAPIGADLALAKYLYVRFPVYALLAALAPAVAVGAYWAGRVKYPRLRGARTAFDVRVGSVLSVLLAAAAIVAMVQTQAPMWMYCAAPLAVFLAAAVAMGRIVSPQAAAIFVDQQAGLRERVSTAYELIGHPATTADEAAFHTPLIASAVEACREVRKSKVGYARLDRRVYLASAVCVAAAIGVGFIEPLPALGGRGMARRIDPAVAPAAEKLAAVLGDMAKKREAKDPAADAVLAPIEGLTQALKAGDISQMDALRAVKDAQREYAEMTERWGAAGKAASALDKEKSLDEFLKATKDYKDALERAKAGDNASEEARQQAEKNLAEAANKVGSGLPGMTPAERSKLEEALKTAEGAAKGDPKLESKLGDARQAAASGDGGKLGESLKQAGGQMGSGMAQGNKNSQAVKDAMDAIDKAGNGLASGSKGGGEQEGGNGEQNAGGKGGSAQSDGGEGSQGSKSEPGGGQGSTASSGGQPNGTGAPGSTNLDRPDKQGGPSDSGITAIGKTGTMVRIYDPKEIATAGKTDKVEANLNKSGAPAGSMDYMGPADKSDPPLVPYEKVLEPMRKDALEQVENGKIPPQYRDVVRAMYGK